MTRFHNAMSSRALSLVPSRARRIGPVRPNDDRTHVTVNARNARQHASNVLAARTRAQMLPSSRGWRTASREAAAGLALVWRGLTGRLGRR